MPQVEVVPCAARLRSACRLKPALQAVSAIFVTGGVRGRIRGQPAPDRLQPTAAERLLRMIREPGGPRRRPQPRQLP